MWFYHKESDVAETITHLETGAQVLRLGEEAELWWRGNVIDRPLEQDEMKLAPSDGEQHFRAICDALLDKGDLAGAALPLCLDPWGWQLSILTKAPLSLSRVNIAQSAQPKQHGAGIYTMS